MIESQPEKYSLQTTRSWEFSGVEETEAWSFVKNKGDNLLLKSKYGKDVIIGILDSGIYFICYSDNIINSQSLSLVL